MGIRFYFLVLVIFKASPVYSSNSVRLLPLLAGPSAAGRGSRRWGRIDLVNARFDARDL